jgi:hypothetical protein
MFACRLAAAGGTPGRPICPSRCTGKQALVEQSRMGWPWRGCRGMRYDHWGAINDLCSATTALLSSSLVSAGSAALKLPCDARC